MGAPLLIVVTGMPGAGKTTIAESLARRFGLPLIAKDEIKEQLYDVLGTDDVEESRRVGRASYALIFGFARTLLAAGGSAIVEANFFCGTAERQFSALPPHRIVQIHCAAPLDILVRRYRGRVRHPGHHDEQKVAGLAARLESGAHSPLALDGELIELDTSQPVDHEAIAERIDAHLGSAFEGDS